MNTLDLRKLPLAALGLTASLMLSTPTHAAALTLDPLITGSAPPASAAGGLNGSWFKVQNDAHFSNYMYTENDPTSPRYGQTAPIKTFGWGTGIWSTGDIAEMKAGQNPYVTQTASTVGAVNYANNIYNNTTTSGAYGTWAQDYVRPLAPLVGGPNACDLATQNTPACAGEQNFAAVFSGYLYVATAGNYDLGVFADDGFTFSLTGANGSVGMSEETLVNSGARSVYKIQSENGLDSLMLDVGYYAIDLSFFNRLEAGVIDLGWLTPGAPDFTTITDGDLFHDVPEPTGLALVSLGLLLGRQVGKRRQTKTSASV